jgi:hypothetical protein
MYAVIRRYTDAGKLIDVMERKPQEVEQVLTSVPGFVSYHAIRDGDTLVTISVCKDERGAEATTRRAAAWVRDNVGPDAVGAPEVTVGEAFINLGSTAASGYAAALHHHPTDTPRSTA